jgi:hypothetical protein
LCGFETFCGSKPYKFVIFKLLTGFETVLLMKTVQIIQIKHLEGSETFQPFQMNFITVNFDKIKKTFLLSLGTRI